MQKKEKKRICNKQYMQKMLSVYDAVLQKRSSTIYKGLIMPIRLFYQNARKAWIKRIVITIINAPVILRKMKKKYIFFGLRYKELLNGLPPGEILIIAKSKSEMIYAFKNRIAFITSHNITHYFLRAYFEGKTESLENEIAKFFKLFSSQQEICYLILTSDTKPADIFFSSLAYNFNGIFRVLCVQHGIFSDIEPDLYLAEGARTPFNILHNESQKEIASKHIKNSELLVMGVPWNIPCVMPECDREVILVGDGWGEYNYEYYLTTLDVFLTLSKLLTANKIGHVYRPHLEEKNVLPHGIFESIDNRPKEDLLSGTPKIFVGMVSTLLFEAFMGGHVVYAIDFNHIGGIKRLFDVDRSFAVTELPLLCSIIAEQNVVRKRTRDRNTLLPLSERFIKAICDIEDIIAKQRSVIKK